MKMLTLLSIFIFSISAFAVTGRTTYQAKIIKPDGYPLEASSVNFRFTILDPAASCVLYIEDYAAVNMTGTGGLISFALGAGTRSYPVSATSFASVFDNSTISFPCQSPGIYNPTSTDARKIVMQFQDSSGWQTLPAMAINTVPYAMYASKSNDSLKLNNKADTAFVEYSTLAGLSCAADQAIKFNGVSFSCITVPAGGSGGITSVTTSGTVLITGGTASAPVISITATSMSSDGYLTSLDYAEFKAKLAASSTQIINTLGYAPVSSSAVATQINNSNLSGDVSGTISSNSVVSVGGKSASQISTSVDDTLAATSSATADTIVKRNSSGNFTANDIYANAAKINYVDIYKPSTNFNIRLQAPTSLSTNYVLNLPTTSGTTGQVLSTDGAGNLSWINPSTGSVVSVSATAPLASTGGATPTISITQATSSTDGYLSSTDFNTFNNKQAATSAAIIATLGYTPADNAASGTYAQKANNLSDLASVATARTNLGLGTLATASTIDLGSASATGIIAEARLQTQSNVTSGTQYTKVTVDGKGRVTSGAQLSSSDVTTALGYTPSNAASAGITTLNGSSSATQTFAIGTSGNSPAFNTAAGTHTLNIPLANTGSVTAGLLSNTDYTTFNNKQAATSAAIIATLGYTPANATSATQWTTNGLDIYYGTGNIGAGVANPSAKLEIASGTASVAPLKFTSGTLLSSAQSGTMEYDGFNFYLTDSTNARRTIATGSSQGTIDNASTINSTGNISMVPVGSVIVSSTTASTNSNTGALVVKGGLGVAGSANIAQNLNVSGSSVIDGTLKLSSMTSGSVLLAGANGTVTQDNSSLFWDGANKRLGIGTASPGYKLHVQDGPAVIKGTNSTLIIKKGGGSPNTLSSESVASFDNESGAGVATNMFTNPGTMASIYLGDTGAPQQGYLRYLVNSAIPANQYLSLAVNSSERMRIDSSGNVGIGTSSPGSTLDVSGSAFHVGNLSATGFIVNSTDNSFSRNVTITNTGTGPALGLNDNGDGVYIARGVGGNPSTIGTTNTSGNKNLNFYNGSTLTMTTTTSGNVGIGTTSPTELFHVKSVGTGIALIETSANNDYAVTRFKTPSKTIEWALGGSATGVADSFYIYDQTSTAVRMLVNSTGNVGIGTTTPSAKLHLAAGTSATASFKLTSGTLLTSPQSGTMEYDGSQFYLTDGANTRRTIATGSSAGTIDNASTINSTGNMSLVPVGSVIVSATTASTNSSTGALVVKGGLGVAGNIYSSGTIVTSSNIQGSEITATSATITPYVYGSVVSGGNITIDSTTHATKGNILLAPNGGNVGVGTTSPQTKLHINNSFNEVNKPSGLEMFINGGSLNADVGKIMISPDGNMAVGGLIYINHQTTPTDRTILNLGTTGFSGTPATMSLSNGNVGIGTSSPISRLHVMGDTNLSIGSKYTWPANSGGGSGDAAYIRYHFDEGSENGSLDFVTENDADDDMKFKAGYFSFMPNAIGNGNVGIGTSNPATRFDVRGANGSPATISNGAIGINFGAQAALLLGTDDSVSGSEYAWIQSHGSKPLYINKVGNNTILNAQSGNVGIGTSAPTFALDVQTQGGAESAIRAKSTGNVNVELNGGAGLHQFIRFLENGTGKWEVGNSSQSSNKFYINPTPGGGITGSKLVIQQDGNVGVGTTAPSYSFQVQKTTSSAPAMMIGGGFAGGPRLQTYGLDADANAWMGLGTDMGGNIYEHSIYFSTGPSNNGRLTIGDYNGTAYNTRMTVLQNGNVGIGTTTPHQALDVNGQIGTTWGTTFNTYFNGSWNQTTAGYAGLLQFEASTGKFYFWNTPSSAAADAANPFPTQSMTIDKNGNVGIGATSPASKLHVNGDAQINAIIGGQLNGSGNFHLDAWTSGADRSVYLNWGNGTGGAKVGNGSATWGPISASAFNTSSDQRLKENIRPIPYVLEKVMQLDPVTFTWKNESRHAQEGERLGLIAQNVEKVFPQAVRIDRGENTLPGGTKLVTYPDLIAPLIGAIKELYYRLVGHDGRLDGHDRQIASIAESKADKAEIEVLKAENVELKNENSAIKAYLCSKDPQATICN